MARKPKAAAQDTSNPTPIESTGTRIELGEMLSEKAPVQEFALWVVGHTPLISHAWSEKARTEMLRGQSGATRASKEKRNPEEDFLNSLYMIDKQTYGFPVTAVKKAILSCAHKDRGIPRSDVMAALWLDAEMVSTRPAYAGARCDMPLVRLYGSKPEMREDMVRIGSGLRKTANLAYRAQFTTWAIRVTGTVNPQMVPPHALVFLIGQAGDGIGIGDWRNEKGGWFGAFHIGNPAEQEAWEKFVANKGPLPKVQPRHSSRAAAVSKKAA
jgi:hypothetical protein